jgi:hypothetical protein
VSVAKFNNAKLELNYQEQRSLPRLPNEIFVAFISSGLNLFVFLFNWDEHNVPNDLNEHNDFIYSLFKL